MIFNDTLEQARRVGAAAAGSLAQYGLSPVPAAYAVWYAHHGGHHPDLSNVLNVLISHRQRITDETCADLYLRHLAPEAERQAIETTGAGLRDALAAAATVLRQAGEDAQVYGENLTEAQAEVDGAGPLDRVRAAIAALIERTSWMFGRNRDLQGQLSKAATQVDTLRRDLDAVRLAANTDALTGIANRRRFDEALRVAAAQSLETGLPVSLILADIDHFKKINDEFGHPQGDVVLRAVAKLLQAGVRGQDVVSRYGGEEFAILMPMANLEQAQAVAERLRARIAAKKIVMRGSGETVANLSMSFGVAQQRPGEAAAVLLNRTDRALYEAKAGGRNRVVAA